MVVIELHFVVVLTLVDIITHDFLFQPMLVISSEVLNFIHLCSYFDSIDCYLQLAFVL